MESVETEAERARRTTRLLLGIDCDWCGERVRGLRAGPHAQDCPGDHRQDAVTVRVGGESRRRR